LVFSYTCKVLHRILFVDMDIQNIFVYGRIMSPVIKEVKVHEEFKRAEDAFYAAMFDKDDIAMVQASDAMNYYESFDGEVCPEYPGF